VPVTTYKQRERIQGCRKKLKKAQRKQKQRKPEVRNEN
jgi:hypothetical protein